MHTAATVDILLAWRIPLRLYIHFLIWYNTHNLKRGCITVHISSDSWDKDSSCILFKLNKFLHLGGSKVEVFRDVNVSWGDLWSEWSALPAAGHIASSLLFACGPVTLQPSFAPRWGPLHHCSGAKPLWAWHTHHTADIMSVRHSQRPQVWAGAESTVGYFNCDFSCVFFFPLSVECSTASAILFWISCILIFSQPNTYWHCFKKNSINVMLPYLLYLIMHFKQTHICIVSYNTEN